MFTKFLPIVIKFVYFIIIVIIIYKFYLFILLRIFKNNHKCSISPILFYKNNEEFLNFFNFYKNT